MKGAGFNPLQAIQNLMGAVDVEQVKNAASKVFNDCGVPGCDKFSLGIACKSCQRFACNNHIYFKPSAPPAPICAACVLGSHPELLEDS